MQRRQCWRRPRSCAAEASAQTQNHLVGTPNAAATVDAAGFAALTALRDLKKDEEITISYVDSSLPYLERRRRLKDLYAFDCGCQRCATERKEMLRSRKR